MSTAGMPTKKPSFLQVLVGLESPALPLDGQRRGHEHARDLGELGGLQLEEAERNPAPRTAADDTVHIGEHEQADTHPPRLQPERPLESAVVEPRRDGRHGSPDDDEDQLLDEEVQRRAFLDEGRDRRRRVDHHEPEDRQEHRRAEKQIAGGRATGVLLARHQPTSPAIARDEALEDLTALLVGGELVERRACRREHDRITRLRQRSAASQASERLTASTVRTGRSANASASSCRASPKSTAALAVPETATASGPKSLPLFRPPSSTISGVSENAVSALRTASGLVALLSLYQLAPRRPPAGSRRCSIGSKVPSPSRRAVASHPARVPRRQPQARC